MLLTDPEETVLLSSGFRCQWLDSGCSRITVSLKACWRSFT